MAEQDIEGEIAQRMPLVAGKGARAMLLVALSISALLHAGIVFALLKLEPAERVEGGAQEIPIEIVVEASDSGPPPAESEPPAQVGPAAAPTEADTAEAQPAPPEMASTEPEPAPPPSADLPQPGDQAAVVPPEPVPPAPPPPQPVAPPPAIEPAPIAPQPSLERRDDIAERRRQEELQQRQRAEAEAKKQEEAAARREAETRQRAEQREANEAASARREASAEPSAPAPARSSVAGEQGSDVANYRSAVQRHLAGFKHYPESARARGANGRAIVSFTLDNGGRVVSARILHSSGQADIDAETLAMVRRAAPFPAPPSTAQRAFSFAIDFHLE